MISSIYCWSLQFSMWPSHFHRTQWSRYHSLSRQTWIHLQYLWFSILVLFSTGKSVFDTLILRIWVGFFFFLFLKWSYILIYNRASPQKQSAYSHSVETWESVSIGERGITSLAFTSMCLRVRTLHVSSTQKETEIAKIWTLVYPVITWLSAHVFNFLVSGMFSNAFVHNMMATTLEFEVCSSMKSCNMRNIFD